MSLKRQWIPGSSYVKKPVPPSKFPSCFLVPKSVLTSFLSFSISNVSSDRGTLIPPIKLSHCHFQLFHLVASSTHHLIFLLSLTQYQVQLMRDWLTGPSYQEIDYHILDFLKELQRTTTGPDLPTASHPISSAYTRRGTLWSLLSNGGSATSMVFSQQILCLTTSPDNSYQSLSVLPPWLSHSF